MAVVDRAPDREPRELPRAPRRRGAAARAPCRRPRREDVCATARRPWRALRCACAAAARARRRDPRWSGRWRASSARCAGTATRPSSGSPRASTACGSPRRAARARRPRSAPSRGAPTRAWWPRCDGWRRASRPSTARRRAGAFARRLADGSVLEEVVRPLDSVGLYVPGGAGAYPSSVLMNAIPARVAGVPRWWWSRRRAPSSRAPRWRRRSVIVGLEGAVYRVGGAQAIAALAFGTATRARGGKIVGPGNAFVAEAKRQVRGIVEIDSDAGPSEVVILADETADAGLGGRRPAGPGRARQRRRDRGAGDAVARAGREVVRLVARGAALGGQPGRDRARPRATGPRGPGARPRAGDRRRQRPRARSTPR